MGREADVCVGYMHFLSTQKGRLVVWMLAIHTQVQWAAALGAAETAFEDTNQRDAFRLQWGRSLGSCGNMGWPNTAVVSGPLQWGRSLGSCGNAELRLIYW
jgi:hypothetical protein